MTTPLLFTIGHSTHSIEDFIATLKAHSVAQLVDIRTIPRSRHNPQYNCENLSDILAKVGVRYQHMAGLGGLRHPDKDSMNTGWRNASFRGFADYMQKPEFRNNLESLLEITAAASTAIMCAEAVPWRCHRSLVADAVVASGISVEHILSATKRYAHTLTPFARVEGSGVTYPGK